MSDQEFKTIYFTDQNGNTVATIKGSSQADIQLEVPHSKNIVTQDKPGQATFAPKAMLVSRSGDDLSITVNKEEYILIKDYYTKCEDDQCLVSVADGEGGLVDVTLDIEGVALNDGTQVLYIQGEEELLLSMVSDQSGFAELYEIVAGPETVIEGTIIHNTANEAGGFGIAGIAGGLLGAGAIAAAVGGSSTATATKIITVSVLLGPLTDAAETIVSLYQADGTKIDNMAYNAATGLFELKYEGDYTGPVIAVLTDHDSATDYINEATKQGADIGDNALVTMSVLASGVTSLALSINEATTAAANKAGITASKDGEGQSIGGVSATPLTEASLQSANEAIATALGLTGVNLATAAAVAVIDAEGDDNQDANAYGVALAQLSQMRETSGESIAQQAATLANGVNDDGSVTNTALADAITSATDTVSDDFSGVPIISTESTSALDQVTQAATSNEPNAASGITADLLASITGVEGVVPGNLAAYQTAIAAADPAPATAADVQAIITAVNDAPPTVMITSDADTLKAGETATITFTLSKASNDFVAADVTVAGGTLSDFAGSGTSYTATFTPTADSTTNGSVSVAAGAFADTDDTPTDNAASTPYTLNVDTSAPTISAATLSWGGTVNAIDDDSDGTITVVTTGVEDGQMAIFSLNGTDYSGEVTSNSATITVPASVLQGLTDGGEYTYSVNVSDAAGNAAPASTGSFTVDTTAPDAPTAAPTLADASNSGSTADTITDDTTPTITVATGLDPAPKLLVGGIEVASTYDPATGSLIPNDPLPEGANAITYQTVDTAGNASAASPALTITVDTTAPTAPAVPTLADASNSGSTTDTVTDDTTPTITVATGLDPAPKLLVGGVEVASTYDPDTGALTPNAPLPEGANAITYQTVDTAGNVSAASPALTITVDTTAPTAPAVPTLADASNSGSTTDTVTDDTTPTITVATGLDPAPKLLVGGVEVASTYDPDTGALTPNAPLPEGANAITYQTVDAAGNVSAASPALTITVDTTAPDAPTAAPTLADASNSGSTADTITDDTTPTITVATGLDPAPKLLVGGIEVASTYDPATGSLIPNDPLPEGANAITYQTVDTAGNASAASPALTITVDTTAPTAPAVPTLADASNSGSTTDTVTDDTTPTITVATGLDPAPKLLVGGVEVASTYDPDTGALTPNAPLPEGANAITYQTVDAAGNASAASPALTITVDTTDPTAPTVNALTTSDTTPTITGTATLVAGESLTVVVNGATYSGVTVTSGVWSIDTSTATPSAGTLGAFVDGSSYEVTATVTDAAGNSTADTTTNEITIDTAAPTAPTVDALTTSNTTPTITGTATLGAGESLTVVVNGATYDNVTVDGSNNWNIDTSTTPSSGTLAAFADGSSYEVTATVTDAASNSTADTSSNEITIDRTDPTAPTVNALTTSDTTPTITGTATLGDGESLSVVVNGATYSNVTVDASNNWSIDTSTATPDTGTTLAAFTATTGNYAVTATVTDAAGNSTVDATTNEITIVPPLQVDSITSPNQIVIAGTTSADGTYTLVTDPSSLTFSDDFTPSGTTVLDTSKPVYTYNDGTNTWYVWSRETSGYHISQLTSTTEWYWEGSSTGFATNPSLVVSSGGSWIMSSAPADGTGMPSLPTLDNVPTNGAATFTITFNEAVSTLNASSLSFVDAAGTAVDMTNWPLGTPTVGTDNKTWTVSVTPPTGANAVDAAIKLVVANDVTSTAGGSMADAYTQVNLQAFDTVAPTVSSVAITGNESDGTATTDTLVAGDKVLVTVTMSEATLVDTTGGIPQYTIDVGGTSKVASFVSGSGTANLVFEYTVAAGDTDAADGITAAANALDANSGTLTDVAGTAANLAVQVIAASANAVSIDAIAPTINNVTLSWGNDLTSVDLAHLHFSEVTVFVNGAEEGQTVTLSLNNKNYTASIGTSDHIMIEVLEADLRALADGSHSYTINVSDAAGNAAQEFTGSFTVDTSPTVNMLTTNNLKPRITGTALLEQGETLTVVVNGATYTNVMVDEFGNNWSIDTETEAVSSGVLGVFVSGNSYDVTATVTDADNNSTVDSTANEITIDTTPPVAPTVNAFSTNNLKPIITGTATLGEGDSLMVSVNGATYNNVTVDSSGNWSIDIDNEVGGFELQPFEDGNTYSITATVRDAAGNSTVDTTSRELTFDITAPTVTGVVISGAESDGTANTETLVVGDKVIVTVTMSEATIVTGTPQYTIDVGGTPKVASYASGSGSTSLVFEYTVAAGDTDAADGITANTTALALNSGTLADAAGNAATLTTPAVAASANAVAIDTTVPAVTPTVNSLSTSDTTPTITGTATLGTGESLSVVVNGATYSNVTVDASNNWSIDTSTASPSSGDLAEFTATTGDYEVTATVTDAAGNSTVDATTNEITIVPPLQVDSITSPNQIVIAGTTSADGTYTLVTDTSSLDFSDDFTPTFQGGMTVLDTTKPVYTYNDGTNDWYVWSRETSGYHISQLNSTAEWYWEGSFAGFATNPSLVVSSGGSWNMSSATADGTSPNPSSLTLDNVPTNSDATFTITFNEAVSTLNASSLSFVDAAGTAVDMSNWTLGTPTVGADNKTWTVSVTPPTGANAVDAAIKLVVANDVTSAAGGSMADAYTQVNLQAFDTEGPTVTGVVIRGANSDDASKTGTLVAGDKVVVTVTMSEDTIVTGTPIYTISIGGTPQTANFVSASSTATSLVFEYTLVAGDTGTTENITAAADALAPGGATLTNAEGNAATLTTPAFTDTGLSVGPLDSSYSISSVQIIEDETADKVMTFVVTREGDLSQAGTVEYAFDADLSTVLTTGANADVTGVSTTATTLTFAAGERFKTVDVTVKGDNLKELNEQVVLKLSNATQGSISEADGVGTILESNASDYAALFGLQDLNLAKETFAIRVRRSLDNQEMDIGFDKFGNLDTDALLRFVNNNSDGSAVTGAKGYVSVWYNQAGDKNLTQAQIDRQGVIVNEGAMVTGNDGTLMVSFNQDLNGVNNDIMTMTGTAGNMTNVEVGLRYQVSSGSGSTAFALGGNTLYTDRFQSHLPLSGNTTYYDARQTRIQVNGALTLNEVQDIVFGYNATAGGTNTGSTANNYQDASMAIFIDGEGKAGSTITGYNPDTAGSGAAIIKDTWYLGSGPSGGDVQNALYGQFLVYVNDASVELARADEYIGDNLNNAFSYAGDAGVTALDGKLGFDTVIVSGDGTNLDVSTLALTSIELIDLSQDTNAQSVTLTQAQVEANGSILNVLMGNGDSVAYTPTVGTQTTITQSATQDMVVFGTTGNDTINMSSYNENVYSLGGSDTFYYSAWSDAGTDSSQDTINGFTVGAGDVLNLGDLLNGETLATLSDFIEVTDAGSGGDVTLRLDIDGTGGYSDLTIVLTDIGTGSLTLADLTASNIIIT